MPKISSMIQRVDNSYEVQKKLESIHFKEKLIWVPVVGGILAVAAGWEKFLFGQYVGPAEVLVSCIVPLGLFICGLLVWSSLASEEVQIRKGRK